jgi:tetratricopeptide (TPR) repeat protein
LVLTDDYSPIENFLAPIVRASAAARAYDEWHRRIGAAVDAKEYERAVDLGREALAALPANPEFESVHANLITELGITLRSQGDAEEALALFREALDLDSSNKRARFGIIDCYGSLGRLEETLPMYDGLLDSDLVRYNYGNTLAQLGRFPEAAKQFEIVTQMNPDFANAYNNWGNTVEQMGDLEAAVELIEIALKLEPDHPDALASLARMVGEREVRK